MWAAVGANSGTIQVPSANHLIPASFGSLEIRKTERTEFIGQNIDYSAQKTIETRLFAIDDLALPRIDFIKIDIEGMEMEALCGAAESITRCKPQMLIEKIKSSENHITEFLKEKGYVIFGLGINLLAIHESDPTSKNVKVNVVSK